MKIFFYIILYSIIVSNIFAMGTAGSIAKYETLTIVDMPTAGVTPKNTILIKTNSYENGGLLTLVSFAPFDRFNIGLSYGASGLIGTSDLIWQDLPGLELKYRIVDEKLNFPAIVIGFSNQGFGSYFPSEKRYLNLSPGFYVALSKSYTHKFGNVAFHGGINYSLEPNPKDRLPNIYAGFEHSLGKYVSLNFEYNANIDEPNNNFMDKRGLFNLSLRASITDGITIETRFRDLLIHTNGSNSINRNLTIEIIKSL